MSQTEIATLLGLSESSVSELLGGQRRRPPDWDAVRRIVGLCAERNGPGAPPPPGMSLDVRWWKGRHAELERTVETASVRRRRPATSRSEGPAEELDATECVDMGLDKAVYVLADGRPELTHHADRLLGPSLGEPALFRVLDELLDGFPQRVRAAYGLPRTVLLHAARMTLMTAATARCASGEEAFGAPHLSYPVYPASAYAWAAGSGHISMALSTAIQDGTNVHLARTIDAEYVRLATPLATSCPEFALTAILPRAGSSDEEGQSEEGQSEEGKSPGPSPETGLAGLGALLAEFAGRGEPPAVGRSLLRTPIASLDSPGPRLPSLASGYVCPRFQLAGPGLTASDTIASDKWWEQRLTHDSFEHFLAAHLLSPSALLTPLLVLGHPGAGKSLLTTLLTARLPAGEFRPLRVELRHTPAEADVQQQLQHGLWRDTGRSVGWPEWSEEKPGVVPVVLLDGFDELLQAGAQRLDSARQWGYLRSIEEFQKREALLGRPLIVIVTSRTVVADRAEIPMNSQVLRLEPFGMPEIDRWLSIWNATNGPYLEQRGLRPLTQEVVRPHRELAAQPLLLLMLALYDAVGNALHRLGDEGISRTQLYERLLTEFVRRQVDKDGSLPPAEEAAAVERELHRLSVIALGMFHRGAQAISGEEADRDLRALADTEAHGEPGATGLLFGRFFFVHEAQALVTEQRLRSYEFMHATFGEHLAARLIERALRKLADTAAEHGRGTLDDGELYALLSFAPLTDRAQLVENLSDLLAAWPAGRARDALPGLLVELFRAAQWEPGHRSGLGHAPVRVTRTYRDVVYEVNLMVIGVAAAGEVYASQFLGTEGLVDSWRRRAMMWRSQLSEDSWQLFSATLSPDRCWKPDPAGVQRPDLRISTVSRPSVDPDMGWLFGIQAESHSGLLEVGTGFFADTASDVFTQITFLGDQHAEHLLHAAYPLLRGMPGTLLTYRTAQGGHFQSAAQSLIALLTRQTHGPAGLPELYAMCLNHTERLPLVDMHPYLEAVSRQLVHDIPVLPDEALLSVLRHLYQCLQRGGPLTWTAQKTLRDCVYTALGRQDPRLTALLADLYQAVIQLGRSDTSNDWRLAVLRLAEAGHSSSTWEWFGLPGGDLAGEYFDDVLAELDLADLAARHPSAVIALLRTAAELGLTDWLAARAAELLGLLPTAAFGLLRPSDLRYLRDALPPGTYDAKFAEVERAWR